MNRGVEIDSRVADSEASLVTTQVRAGLVVRMAVLYDLLTARPGRSTGARHGGRALMLHCHNGRGDTLELAGRVVAPAQGIDECLKISIESGVISRIEPAPASELVIAPAFVDPHVHLRTPGREDEETIRSGTEAAAAGGYCTILAMPNTDPVVDSASVLGELVERARREAVVPTGFMAAISKGQRGEELTEMAELADTGAVAFTDDGRPVVSAGLMRRALQYCGVTGRPLALHSEEPTLSRGGHAHEGVVSAELGLGPYPAAAESVMVERDLALAGIEDRRVHLMHLSAKASVDAVRRAPRGGSRRDCGGHPPSPVPDRRGGALPRSQHQDEPAPPRGGRPGSAQRRPSRRHDHVYRDRPCATRAPREGRAVRGGTLRGHRPRDGVLGSLHDPRRPGSAPARDAPRADVAGPARAFGLDEPRIEVGARANLGVLDLDAEWTVTEDGFRSLSANSWLLGERLRGRVLRTVADGRLVFSS